MLDKIKDKLYTLKCQIQMLYAVLYMAIFLREELSVKDKEFTDKILKVIFVLIILVLIALGFFIGKHL